MTTTDQTAYRCRIRGCPRTDTTYVGFTEFASVSAYLCDRHKPTAEQALRRGIVATEWTVHGYYPGEIAMRLSSLTGRTIRESTVIADLKWLGLTEANRAAAARLTFDLPGDPADSNVIPLRARRA